MQVVNGGPERILYLYITQACTLRCRHCYVGNDRLNNQSRFTVRQAEETLRYFTMLGFETVYFLGGEPTLHPDLAEIVGIAGSLGYAVGITTNGDFSETLFEELPPSAVRALSFSLESPEPGIHAEVRGSTANHARVVSRIKRAVELGYLVRVICTVTKANFRTALQMIPFAASLGVQSLAFHNTGLTGNAATQIEPLTPSEWRQFCSDLIAFPKEPNLSVFYPPTYVNMQEQVELERRGYRGCPARRLERPHVYPDGRVYACPVLMDGNRHYGRVVDGKLKINLSPDNEMNGYLAADSMCLGCPASRRCGGGCPAFDMLPAYEGWFRCDQEVTPICMLWTTFVGDDVPPLDRHRFR